MALEAWSCVEVEVVEGLSVFGAQSDDGDEIELEVALRGFPLIGGEGFAATKPVSTLAQLISQQRLLRRSTDHRGLAKWLRGWKIPRSRQPGARKK